MTARRTLLVCALAALPLALATADAPKPGEIKKAFKSGNADTVKGMLKTLEGNLDKKAMTTLLKSAPKLRPLGVYSEMVATLRTASGEALEELVKAYKKEKKGDMRFLVIDALGTIEDVAAEQVLATAIEKDKDPPVRVMAVRLMAKRYTMSAVDSLIRLLGVFEEDAKQERLTREINSALANLTAQEGLTVAQDWENYWATNKDSYKKPADPEEDPKKTKTRGKLGERMAKERPAEMKTLTRLSANEILVIKGNDKVESALKALDLKHTLMQREEFDALELDPDKQVLIFNCPGSKELTEAGIEKVRKFVAMGGYIFCSDWELGKTLAKAFPKTVTFLKESARSDKPQAVTIQPFPQTKDHPLMRDVFPLNAWDGRSLAWKLEGRSHLVNDKKSAIVPLVSCPDIAQTEGTTTVAFTFAYTAEGGGRPVTGRQKTKRPPGRVLFVSSHFKLQKDESGDGFALQQLLLNFIVEKQEQRKIRR